MAPELPSDAEKLLAVAPEDFVEERKNLARKLRDEGRRDEATAVSAMRKPSRVVLAVNGAARDRPQAAKDAANAAERLGRTQLSGKPTEYRALVKEMEDAMSLVSEVAVAHLSKGRSATEAMRRRVADHLRGALSTAETRGLLARGALTDEIEPAGFDALAGLPIAKTRARRERGKPAHDEAQARRARERALLGEISEARKQLADAEQTVREATRQRDKLAKRLEELEALRKDA